MTGPWIEREERRKGREEVSKEEAGKDEGKLQSYIKGIWETTFFVKEVNVAKTKCILFFS